MFAKEHAKMIHSIENVEEHVAILEQEANKGRKFGYEVIQVIERLTA